MPSEGPDGRRTPDDVGRREIQSGRRTSASVRIPDSSRTLRADRECDKFTTDAARCASFVMFRMKCRLISVGSR